MSHNDVWYVSAKIIQKCESNFNIFKILYFIFIKLGTKNDKIYKKYSIKTWIEKIVSNQDATIQLIKWETYEAGKIFLGHSGNYI